MTYPKSGDLRKNDISPTKPEPKIFTGKVASQPKIHQSPFNGSSGYMEQATIPPNVT